jgi:hypothetical protein
LNRAARDAERGPGPKPDRLFRWEAKPMSKTDAKTPGRRGFFKAATAVAAASAAAVVAPAGAAKAAESEAEKKKARYRESDHVKKYYQTNRY